MRTGKSYVLISLLDGEGGLCERHRGPSASACANAVNFQPRAGHVWQGLWESRQDAGAASGAAKDMRQPAQP